MADRHYHIILNPRAGTASALGLTGENVGERFAREGYSFDIDAHDERPLEERIEAALAGPADVIVAGGGDGTAAAIAQALVGTDKALAVLPLGTYNALSKDLGVPLDIDAAIIALRAMEKVKIDAAEVNGKIFLHNVLIGVIPGIAVGREAMRDASPLQWIGFIRFIVRRVSRAKRMAIVIDPDNSDARVERVQAIAVANNSYDEKLGGFLTRKRLDRGSLSLYVMKTLRVRDMLRITAEMFAGRWRGDDAISFESVRALTIRTHKPNLLVSLDGEVLTLSTPLNFEVKPQALLVLGSPEAPPVKAAETVPEGESVPQAEAVAVEA
ncbi:MAG: diacylglycerol kinase family protein [Devosia sp.]